MYKLRTNIILDDNMVEKAFKLTKVKTKKELVNIALKEFIEHHRKKNLAEIRGKIEFSENYDYKTLRK